MIIDRRKPTVVAPGSTAVGPQIIQPASASVAAKRLLDVAASLTLMVVLSPFFALAALAILAVDRHSPFYLDERVGMGGRKFRCWKFRTIRSDEKLFAAYLEANPAEAERYRISRKLNYDPRKTPLGSLLRRTSIDELPQLLNVLKGDMSLVGPRPISEREFLRRGDDRFLLAAVRPGMTGLWQVSGRSDLDDEQRIELDNRYVLEWSLAMDLAILGKTPLVVLTAKGAR